MDRKSEGLVKICCSSWFEENIDVRIGVADMPGKSVSLFESNSWPMGTRAGQIPSTLRWQAAPYSSGRGEHFEVGRATAGTADQSVESLQCSVDGDQRLAHL